MIKIYSALAWAFCAMAYPLNFSDILTSKISPEKWSISKKCADKWHSLSSPPNVPLRDSIEVPYYSSNFEVDQILSDNQSGTPFEFHLKLIDLHSCVPLKDAAVEIWHANATGHYSGFSGFNPVTGVQTSPCIEPLPKEYITTDACPTDSESFLRGSQVSDKKGDVMFDTIFPGQYTGRSTHIHITVKSGGKIKAGSCLASKSSSRKLCNYYDGGKTHLMAQIFFEDGDVEKIRRSSPEYPLLLEGAHTDETPEIVHLEDDIIFLLTNGIVADVKTKGDGKWVGTATLLVDTKQEISVPREDQSDPSVLVISPNAESLFTQFRKMVKLAKDEDTKLWNLYDPPIMKDWLHSDEEKVVGSVIKHYQQRKEAEKRALMSPRQKLSFFFDKPITPINADEEDEKYDAYFSNLKKKIFIGDDGVGHDQLSPQRKGVGGWIAEKADRIMGWVDEKLGLVQSIRS